MRFGDGAPDIKCKGQSDVEPVVTKALELSYSLRSFDLVAGHWA